MRRIAGIGLIVLLTACGSDAADTAGATTLPSSAPATQQQPTSTVTTEPETTTKPSTPTTTEPDPDGLAVFIAAAEEMLAGTVYEGAAIEEPELFLATGWLFCEWLDAGDSPDSVLERYVDELAGSVEAATDDQLVVAGALLGAAVGVLCPHQAGALDG